MPNVITRRRSVLAGVCGVGPVPADTEEAPAEGLQGRLPPLSPNSEHPRLPGREGVYDGPHRVHEPNTVHCTTGNTLTRVKPNLHISTVGTSIVSRVIFGVVMYIFWIFPLPVSSAPLVLTFFYLFIADLF